MSLQVKVTHDVPMFFDPHLPKLAILESTISGTFGKSAEKLCHGHNIHPSLVFDIVAASICLESFGYSFARRSFHFALPFVRCAFIALFESRSSAAAEIIVVPAVSHQ